MSLRHFKSYPCRNKTTFETQITCVKEYLAPSIAKHINHAMKEISIQQATNDLSTKSPEAHKNTDRIGIIASVLCAIHCACTPILLILLPTFGKAWSHPATHWGMALIVIPIAVFMLKKGYRKHGKKWIVGLGVAGITFIIIGAILPYTEAATYGLPDNTETVGPT